MWSKAIEVIQWLKREIVSLTPPELLSNSAQNLSARITANFG